MSVRLADLAIHDITALPIAEANAFFGSLEFSTVEQAVAEPLVREIRRRLDFLQRVGVDYLSLDSSHGFTQWRRIATRPLGNQYRLGIGWRLLHPR